MHNKNLVKSIFIAFNIFIILQTSYSQSDESFATAKQNFSWGLNAFKKKDFKSAIDYFLISIANYPQNITYYSLAQAYAGNQDPGQTLYYSDLALSTPPALRPMYVSSISQLRKWAYDYKAVIAKVTAGALTVLPAVPPTQAGSEDLLTYNNSENNSSIEKVIIFPGGGIKTDGNAEIATLSNTSNAVVGYIKYYGFGGGRNLGNDKSSATTFSVGVSNSNDPNDFSSFSWIQFKIDELYPSSQKSRQVGNISYKIIILAVQKYQTDSYIMGSVRAQVTALYPSN